MANANPFSRPAEGHKWEMFIKIALALGAALLVLYGASEWHKAAFSHGYDFDPVTGKWVEFMPDGTAHTLPKR